MSDETKALGELILEYRDLNMTLGLMKETANALSKRSSALLKEIKSLQQKCIHNLVFLCYGQHDSNKGDLLEACSKCHANFRNGKMIEY